MKDRTAEIVAWIETFKASVEAKTAGRIPGNRVTAGYDAGPKNIRVWLVGTSPDARDKRVYCFIDKFGNIMKASGWKVPAKGVRGTIDTIDASTLDDSTWWLYRMSGGVK